MQNFILKINRISHTDDGRCDVCKSLLKEWRSDDVHIYIVNGKRMCYSCFSEWCWSVGLNPRDYRIKK